MVANELVALLQQTGPYEGCGSYLCCEGATAVSTVDSV